jgi:hypothetical protein
MKAGFWGLIGVEIWGEMHAGEDPIAPVAAARKFVEELVAEAWSEEQVQKQGQSVT